MQQNIMLLVIEMKFPRLILGENKIQKGRRFEIWPNQVDLQVAWKQQCNSKPSEDP